MKPIIIFAFILSLFGIIIFYKFNVVSENQETPQNLKLSYFKEAYFAAEDVFAYAYIYAHETPHLDVRNLQFLKNRNLKREEIRTLMNKFTFFVYVPELVCENCLFGIIEELIENKAICNTAFVLSDSLNLNILDRISIIPPENILLLKKKLNIPIEEEEIIFMFTLSNDDRIHNIYVPDRKLDNLTKIYLSIQNKQIEGLRKVKI